jgi:D-glycerate 3-kinase
MMLNILKKLVYQKALDNSDLELLLFFELNDLNNPFDLKKENILEEIKKRIELFLQVYDEIINICEIFNLRDRDVIFDLLWKLWLPLSIKIHHKKINKQNVFIQGILGSQGTGKTTLTKILALILQFLGWKTISISLDDLYKTYQERQELKIYDPRLIWRGPPLTHDINLGLQLFNNLQKKEVTEILIPHFDKSAYNGMGDRTNFETINKPDIVLFEGWFIGVKPIEESLFNYPPQPILTPEDIEFAKDNNKRLLDYLPLWEKLDSLIILSPKDYRFSLQWRKEAEQKMILDRKTGMTEEEITEFVNYFWRSLHPELFIKPLTKNSQLVDLVIEIDQNHLPENIYKPQ